MRMTECEALEWLRTECGEIMFLRVYLSERVQVRIPGYKSFERDTLAEATDALKTHVEEWRRHKAYRRPSR